MVHVRLRNQPLVFYCTLVILSISVAIFLIIWISKSFGYDGGGDDLDHTTMFEAWSGILGALGIVLALITGTISGIYRLIKPRGYSRKLLALYTFGPLLIVAFWVILP